MKTVFKRNVNIVFEEKYETVSRRNVKTVFGRNVKLF